MNKVELKPTAWGNTILEVADAEEDGSFPDALQQFGYIEEDSITLNVTDGEKLQLFEAGHILRDLMQLESEISIGVNIIGIPEPMRKKFWDMDETETKKARVKSLVNNKKFATRLSTPKIPGSETLEAPYCTINMKPEYDEKKGWKASLEITLIKGPKDYFFDFGIVEEKKEE